MKTKNVLVVEAHSDDSAISAIGFLQALKKRGFKIHFYLAAVSTMHLHHKGVVTRDERIREYKSYVEEMGGCWDEKRFPPFDNESRLDTVPRADIVREVEKVIMDVKPEVMILQGSSFHHDHAILYESTIAATRPTARHIPDQIYIMENPTYVHSLGPSTDFSPNFYVPMTESQTDKKLSVFSRCFPSQVREEGNYLSAQGIKSWARYRGIEARAEYAEAFRIFRSVSRDG